MDGQEIIEMAKQAGCIPRRHPEFWDDVQVFATPEVLQAFAHLVAARARKELAKEFAGLGEWTCVNIIEAIDS